MVSTARLSTAIVRGARGLCFAVLVLLTQTLWSQTLTADSVMRALSGLPLHDVEGIWQLTDDGNEVVIRREDPRAGDVASYSMILLHSSDRLQRPGTLLGHLSPTAQPGVYDARIFTSTDGKGRPSRPKRFTLKLEDKAHLSFVKVNSGIRISPFAVFPRFLRRAVRIVDDRSRDLDGAIKIYPRVPIKGSPRYL